MKLRQKLAMVLASAMIVSAVPVVTMAASTNTLSSTIEATEGTVVNGNVSLQLNFDKVKEEQSTTFFLNSEAFDFNAAAYKNAGTIADASDEIIAAQQAVKEAEQKVEKAKADLEAIKAIIEEGKDLADEKAALETAQKNLKDEKEKLATLENKFQTLISKQLDAYREMKDTTEAAATAEQAVFTAAEKVARAENKEISINHKVTEKEITEDAVNLTFAFGNNVVTKEIEKAKVQNEWDALEKAKTAAEEAESNYETISQSVVEASGEVEKSKATIGKETDTETTTQSSVGTTPDDPTLHAAVVIAQKAYDEEAKLSDAEKAQIAAAQQAVETAEATLVEKQEALEELEALVGDHVTIQMNGFQITIISKNQARITTTVGENGQNIHIPLYGTVQKGIPTINVDGKGSLATSGSYVLADEVTSNKKLAAKAGTPKSISVEGDGVLGDIIIEEKEAGAVDEQTIFVALPNSSDLVFTDKQTSLKVEGERGLYGEVAIKNVEFVTVDGEVDNKKLAITLDSTAKTYGSAVLKGLEVESEDPRQDVKLGKVEVRVSGEQLEDTRLHVADVVDYGVILSVEKEVAPVAGREAKKVQVTLDEKAIGTLNDRHDVYFEVENANIVPGTFKIVEGNAQASEKINDKTKEVEHLVLDLDKNTTNKGAKIVMEFEVQAKAVNKGEITLVAESRNFDKAMELKLGEVEQAITVEAEATTLKVGLKGQKGGKITITETKEAMLPRGEEIAIDILDGKIDGIHLVDAKVEAEDIQIKDVKVEDGQILLTIKRESEKAGKITISDIEIDTDRNVPEGTFDAVIGGEAISIQNSEKTFQDAITLKDFVVVGTKNTEDNTTNNGLTKGTASFKVGEKTFIHNGEEKTMDAAPYITNKDRVMVPVRYISEAFGVKPDKILFNQGTVTMFVGQRVIQVQNGSNIAIVNGVKVPMDEKMTIKNDRSYIPMGEIARLLDINVAWDNNTKTVTFSN